MRCSLCGLDFKRGDIMSSCENCFVKKGDCDMLRCPNCGFENPGEPQLFKMIKRWRN